ncbi:Hypothetical protein A7982_07854 [Minicystis rosea]|nr:Hypothetical protein A7982_07854 [Minicystis rosea]
MTKPSIILLCVAVVLAFMIGWFAGRWALERSWKNPVVTVTADDVKRASVEGADPSPAAGTAIFRPLPLRKMREIMKSFTAQDPVVMKVGSWSRDDDDKDLHLVLENRGDCKTTRVAGVAYGYHARGNAEVVSKSGDYYIAFDSKEVKLDPKASDQMTMKVKDPGHASLAMAHVDLVECEGGKIWKR